LSIAVLESGEARTAYADGMIDRVRCRLVMSACLALLVAGMAGGAEEGGSIVAAPPDEPVAGGRYVFYLHGRIIEDGGERPTHPRFGVYEYREILEDLAATGATVISEPRPSRTVADVYARRVADQVRGLLDAGVVPERITVVGFSKGGAIAMLASSLLQEPEVRFVFLASCGGWIEAAPGLRISGRVLAIREESDEIGRSCERARAQGGELTEFKELVINTGEEHGVFYRPRPEWLGPVKSWILAADHH